MKLMKSFNFKLTLKFLPSNNFQFATSGLGQSSQHFPFDDRKSGAGQDAGRRDRLDGHHGGLRRVQDWKDAAVAHPLCHHPNAR